MENTAEMNSLQDCLNISFVKFSYPSNNKNEDLSQSMSPRQSLEIKNQTNEEDYSPHSMSSFLKPTQYYQDTDYFYFQSLDENNSYDEFSSLKSEQEKQFMNIEISNEFPKLINRNLKSSKRGLERPITKNHEEKPPKLKSKRIKKVRIPSKPLELETGLQAPKTCKKCQCKNSRCVKLYCECFASQGYCGDDCQCQNCLNDESKKDFIKFLRMELIEKNPFAFSSKYKLLKEKSKPSAINSRGCHCTKTMCLKNYCECFNAGIGCSAICGCLGCGNSKVGLRQEEVEEYKVKLLRKRKKTKFLCDFFFNERAEKVQIEASFENSN